MGLMPVMGSGGGPPVKEYMLGEIVSDASVNVSEVPVSGGQPPLLLILLSAKRDADRKLELLKSELETRGGLQGKLSISPSTSTKALVVDSSVRLSQLPDCFARARLLSAKRCQEWRDEIRADIERSGGSLGGRGLR